MTDDQKRSIMRKDPRYRKMWGHLLPSRKLTGSPAPPSPSPRIPLPQCVHFNDRVKSREAPDGKVCGCSAKWLYSCDLHGSCARTATAKRPGVACCEGCPDYDSGDETAYRRHLLYYLCPFPSTPAWRKNVEELARRAPLFNGVRAIAVASGAGLDRIDKVREEFARYSFTADIFPVPHNKKLREVVAFRPLWERVESLREPGDVTFYAHAKGVSRPWNDGVTCHPWTRLLYEVNLDYWPLVEGLLKRYPTCGSLKKVGHGFRGSKSTWHYSGAYGWFRNEELFSRDWKRIDAQWWGTEAWPGLQFAPDEAGVVFFEGRVPSLNLYDINYLRGTIEPSLAAWRVANAGNLQTWTSS